MAYLHYAVGGDDRLGLFLYRSGHLMLSFRGLLEVAAYLSILRLERSQRGRDNAFNVSFNPVADVSSEFAAMRDASWAVHQFTFVSLERDVSGVRIPRLSR
eukprot:CAMPEP_0194528232 /NCGR_PEP_ID=MMETSP0253-20130528/64572_1 /TAXON_ID=2966 /ORGANISM="Noctiluca scintillans" /LENGTH=100 /DNA_ID=CAMNT_0039373267 /DNA_START=603 /DNA_END=905 /DNA_ORIENTATION=+